MTMTKSLRPALILGSSSPRRRDLLTTVGLPHLVIKPDVEERPQPGEAPLAYVRRNAAEKADWVAAHAGHLCGQPFPAGFIVISADTIVVLDDEILEKPADTKHATTMLRSLSGRSHTVITGVTLRRGNAAGTLGEDEAGAVTFAVSTTVQIKPLAPAEIAAYVRTGEPLDKAGGYAAQGIGSYMVRAIAGSYTNVVGLPVAEVVEHLQQDFSYPLWEP